MWDLTGRTCLKFWSNFHAESIVKASELGERVQSIGTEGVLPVVPFNREKTEHLKSHLILEKCSLSSFGFIKVYLSSFNTTILVLCSKYGSSWGCIFSTLCLIRISVALNLETLNERKENSWQQTCRWIKEPRASRSQEKRSAGEPSHQGRGRLL